MIARAREAGVLFSWVAGGLRRQPEAPRPAGRGGHPYVMATACSDVTPMAADGMRADEAGALVPKAGWQRVSCAHGSKGPRLYDWALIGIAEGPGHHLLVRRSPQPGEKGAGLDHYQVRKCRSWYRYATLAMLAHAFLTVTARAGARPHPAHRRRGPPPVQPPDPGRTLAGISRALVSLATTPPGCSTYGRQLRLTPASHDAPVSPCHPRIR